MCGWLVRSSVLTQATEVSWRLSGSLRSALADAARAQLSTLRLHLDAALRLERAVALAWFRDVLEGRGRHIPDLPSYIFWPVVRPVVQRDLAHYLAHTRRAFPLVFQPGGSKKLEALDLRSDWHPISRMLFCNLATVARRRVEAEAGLRLVVMAGELEAVRAKSGAYPAKRPDTADAIDPATNAPFHYESTGTTYVLRGGEAVWPAPAGSR